MRKAGIVVALLMATVLGGCWAGPQQLNRTVDDWDGKLYTESPWLDAVLYVVPVIPLAKFGASIGDFFVGNAYSFWIKDAWDGKGTGFKHKEFLGTDGHMKSLLLDDGKFMEVSGAGS